LTYVVERGGVPVAPISPPAAPAATLGDLKALLRERRNPNSEYASTVHAVVVGHNKFRRRRDPWAR